MLATTAAVCVVALLPAPGGAAVEAGTQATALRFSPVLPVADDSAKGGQLAAVSCPAPWACVAVGADADDRGIHSEGTEAHGRWTWSPSTPLRSDASGVGRFAAVSCPSTARCVAVGEDGHGEGIVASATRLAGAWRWSAPTGIAPDASGGGGLTGVSCPAPTSCVAVGTDASSQGIVVAGRASGGSWSWGRAQAVVADYSGGGSLAAVSCPTASRCVAVGMDDADQAIVLAARRSTSTWTWTPTASVPADASGDGGFDGVACPTSTACVADGTDGDHEAVVDVGRPHGATFGFAVPHAVASDSTGAGSFVAVACPSTSFCVATGADGAGRAIYATMRGSESNAAWGAASPIASSVSDGIELAGVACGSPDSCASVGGDVEGDAVASTTVAPPEPPRSLRPVRSNAKVTVTWRAPSFDGGAAVRTYRVLARPGGGTCTASERDGAVLSCTVGHLVNGTPYRFEVTADNGVGESEPSAWSAPAVPGPYGPPVPNPFTGAIDRLVASRSGVVTICVFDVRTGQTWTILPSSAQHTASIVKVNILAALLYDHQEDHEALSAATTQLATLMIEESDNSAASQLFNDVGAAPGLAAFDKRIGLTGTTPNVAWGFTDTTSLDQVRLVELFVLANKVLDDASRHFGLELMLHVDPEQAWGVSGGVPAGVQVALKNGWYPTAPEAWQINSIGWINGKGRNYVIAVLTDGDETMAYGVETIEDISALVFQRLAPPSRAATSPRDRDAARAASTVVPTMP